MSQAIEEMQIIHKESKVLQAKSLKKQQLKENEALKGITLNFDTCFCLTIFLHRKKTSVFVAPKTM